MKKWIVVLTLPLIIGLAGCGLFDKTEEKKEEPKEIEEVVFEKEKEEEKVEKEETDVKEDTTVEEDTQTEAPMDDILQDKEQVQVYVDEVRNAYLQIAELGGRWNELREASSAQVITDYEFADIIAVEILPWNMALIETLEAIIPPNEETVLLHEMLIEAMNKQHLAFSEIMDAVYTGDYTKITKANEILAEVRKADRDFGRQMEALIEKYGVY